MFADGGQMTRVDIGLYGRDHAHVRSILIYLVDLHRANQFPKSGSYDVNNQTYPTMALTPTPASTTDKTSIYFDAPLLMEHSPPEHQSGDNGVPHLASGTVESGDDEHPVEENGQVGRFHECDSNELAYVNGHWIHKQASSDDEPSIPRTASPDRYVASPTNGTQRDNLHTSDNEYPEGFAEGDVNENQEPRSPIYANGTDVRADPAGPVASPDREENLHQRHASANASLTPKQRSKIVKTESKRFFAKLRDILAFDDWVISEGRKAALESYQKGG